MRRRAAMAVVVGSLCAIIFGAPAWAHNSLASSDPKNGARLGTAPSTVRLTFLARLDPKRTAVAITGPDRRPAASGRPVFEGATVRVPVAATFAGQYSVAYEVGSSDGHPVKGTIRFVVTVGATPPTAVSPSASVRPDPVPTSTTPAATAPRPASATTTGDGAAPWWPWALGGLALVAAAAGAVVLRR